MKTKLVCSLLLMASLNAVADTARTSAITHWGNCGGGTRTWWDDMCMKWRKKMGSKGWGQWWRNYHLVKINRYTDPNIAGWGNDDHNLDAGDAALICTHGGYNNNGWYGTMHTKEHNQCAINTNEMKLGPSHGSGKLRFWLMSSCNSIRWSLKGKWLGPAAHKVHVITGFHGLMYIGKKYVAEYGALASQAFSSKGVGKTWVDKMHHVDHWYNSWKNVCPISLGFGNTQSTALNAQNEKYTSRWSHKTPYWYSYRYKKGCNPDGGSKLPN